METFRPKLQLFLLASGIVVALQLISMFITRFAWNSLGMVALFCGTIVSITSLIFVWYTVTIQDQVWTQNKMRLLPIHEGKLVLANHLSTLVTWMGFAIVKFLLEMLNIVVNQNGDFSKYFESSQIQLSPGVIALIFAVGLLLIVSIMVIVSFINISTKTIVELLPMKMGKLLVGVLYVVIFVVLMEVISRVLLAGLNNLEALQHVAQLSAFAGIILLILLVLWTATTLMMQRFVSTKK